MSHDIPAALIFASRSNFRPQSGVLTSQGCLGSCFLSAIRSTLQSRTQAGLLLRATPPPPPLVLRTGGLTQGHPQTQKAPNPKGTNNLKPMTPQPSRTLPEGQPGLLGHHRLATEGRPNLRTWDGCFFCFFNSGLGAWVEEGFGFSKQGPGFRN